MPTTVLVVDDEEDILHAIADALEREGIVAHRALNGKQALEILKRQGRNIHIMITDILMPDISGVELLLMAKEINPDIKVIVITAYGSEDVRREVYSKGAIAYLEKPFDIAELIKKVEELSQQKKTPEWTLTELLQLITLEGRSATVDVTTPDGRGRIYIVNGEIYNAEFKGLKGKEAFLKLISYEKPSFQIKWNVPKVERLIFKPLYLLLLEVIVGPGELPKYEEKKEPEKSSKIQEESEVEEKEKSPVDIALEQVSKLFRSVEPEVEEIEELSIGAKTKETGEPSGSQEYVSPEKSEGYKIPTEISEGRINKIKGTLVKLLNELSATVRDAELLAVADNTGTIIAYTANDNFRSITPVIVEQVISGYKLLLEQLAKANVSAPYELLISTKEGYILIRNLKGRGYLVGMLSEDKASSLGIFKLKIQEFSPRVEEVMA